MIKPLRYKRLLKITAADRIKKELAAVQTTVDHMIRKDGVDRSDPLIPWTPEIPKDDDVNN